jgi:hypothetical protein
MRKTMKWILPSILLLSALSGFNTIATEARRPNILWLIAEDMGPEVLSRAGTPQAWTPNIDRLASEGTYYSHTYLGQVCSVSRSSLMTGMYATSIGAHNHRTTNKQPLPAGVRVLTEWLRAKPTRVVQTPGVDSNNGRCLLPIFAACHARAALCAKASFVVPYGSTRREMIPQHAARQLERIHRHNHDSDIETSPAVQPRIRSESCRTHIRQ